MRFERLAFDANAAIDSLRPTRPFPLPLKEARALFMPLFVLAELCLGAARSRQTTENGAQVEALARRCKVIVADLDTIPFISAYETFWPESEPFRSPSKNAKHSGTISGLPHSASSLTSRF